MGNRRRYLLATGIVIIAFVGWVIWLCARPRSPEPVFNGIPLSEWRDILVGKQSPVASIVPPGGGLVTMAAPSAGGSPVVWSATSIVNIGSITAGGTNLVGLPGVTVSVSPRSGPAVAAPVANPAPFIAMGTNAAPILIAIIDSSVDDPVRSIYRTFWPWMPRGIQTRYPRPPDVGPLLTNAALTLTQLGDTRFNIQLYQTQKSQFIRRFAIVAIGFNSIVKDRDATLALVEALKDRDPVIRQKAALGLAVYGRDINLTTAPLLKSLHDSDTLVRFHSAVALSRIPEHRQEALPEILKGLRNGSPFVCAEAGRVLADNYPGETTKPK